MPADTVQDGAGTVLARAPKSPYIPELLEEGQTYDGPFVQVEAHGADATVTMTVADSDSTWTDVTLYVGVPIEGHFTAVNPTSGNVLAYRKRA